MTRFLIPVFMFYLAVLLVVPVFAARDVGVGVGDNMPHALDVPDMNGEIQSFEALVGQKGMVLVFVRSIDWCPYCQTQLIELGENGNEITELGYSLVVLSYDTGGKIAKFTEKYSFEYPFLSDEKSEVIGAFGILNTEMKKGTRYYGVPYPGMFIISHDGIIQGKLFEDSYKDRPPVEEIVKTIKILHR